MQWSKHQIKMQPTKKTRDIRVLLYGVNLDNMSFVAAKVSTQGIQETNNDHRDLSVKTKNDHIKLKIKYIQ